MPCYHYFYGSNDLSRATCREPGTSKKGAGLDGQNIFFGTPTGPALQTYRRVQVRKLHYQRRHRSVIPVLGRSGRDRRGNPTRNDHLYQGQTKTPGAQCASRTPAGQGGGHRARRGRYGPEENRGRYQRDPGIHPGEPCQKKNDPSKIRQGGRRWRPDRTAPDAPDR